MQEPFAGGVVLHTGRDTFELGDRILAAPVSTLWAEPTSANLQPEHREPPEKAR